MGKLDRILSPLLGELNQNIGGARAVNPKSGHGVTLLNGGLGSIFVLLFMRKNEKR
jgi:hypothetical protein